MSVLDLWKNPLLDSDTKLDTASAEIESLRKQLAEAEAKNRECEEVIAHNEESVSELNRTCERLEKLIAFWKTSAQECATEFKRAEAELNTEREIKTEYGKRIDALVGQLSALESWNLRL